MPYVNRDASGSIIAHFANEQHPGQEFVTDSALALSESSNAKATQLVNVRTLREVVLGRLEGIASRAARAGDTTGIAVACDVAAVSLLGITTAPAVLAATDGPSTKVALAAEWATIAANLSTAAPAASKAFSGMVI